MNKYQDMKNATNWQNAIPMSMLRNTRFKEIGFWGKINLWIRGKL